MKNYSNHGLKGLVLATALSAFVATPSYAVNATFTEIPVSNNYLGGLAVSNNGIVAIKSYPNLYKWSATTGLTTLGLLTGSSSDSNISKPSISTDGSVVAFTGNGFDWVNSYVFTGTQKRTVPYTTLSQATQLSSDGKILGGAGYASFNPATFNLATNVITKYTNPILDQGKVIDLSSNGSIKLVSQPYDEYLNKYYWVDAAGTIKTVPGWGAFDLSNDGKTVIFWMCNVSGTSYTACSWNSSTGAVKGLGNFIPYSASLNASVVVGVQAGAGIIWNSANGARDIKTVLAEKGVNISDWSNITLVDTSDDGKYIVGTGKHPSGVIKPFLIKLP